MITIRNIPNLLQPDVFSINVQEFKKKVISDSDKPSTNNPHEVWKRAKQVDPRSKNSNIPLQV